MRAYLKQPWAIIAILAWFLGVAFVGDLINQLYWNVRFIPSHGPVDARYVLIPLSDGSDASREAWTDDDSAMLIAAVAARNPSAIYFDPRSDEPFSPKLLETLRAQGSRATVVVRGSSASVVSKPSIAVPDWLRTARIRIVGSAWQTNYWYYAQSSPYSFVSDGLVVPALSADLAGVGTLSGGQFTPDFRTNLRLVRTLRPVDLLRTGSVREDLTGKAVVISRVRTTPDQLLGYYGKHGRYDPVYVDIAAGTGVHRAIPSALGGLPLLLLFIGFVAATRRIASGSWRAAAYFGIAATLLVAPMMVQTAGFFTRTQEAYVAALVYAVMRLWYKWRRKLRETSQSGLPNFVAMVQEKDLADGDIVVGVIARYEEFLASIPGSLHGECARQIARRFAVGCGARTIYHGDGGYFAWSEPARPADQQIEHLEGMRALFAAPLLVGGHMFDTNVHFGLDRNYKLDGHSRVNTALASASEALRDGHSVELYEADRLANAAWELSLLARIDEGMRNGDIWLAYQPQWDYTENRISGAEALIRWNDPVRGPIRPDEFILQAERAGRIDALTYWVLEQAISAADEFNANGPRFQTSINLSAQLVDKPGLVNSVREIVRRRGVDCRLLTVEVTETAHLGDRPAAIVNLRELQAMGFRLSIDDFGTGEASLLYLAQLPSDELKLDRQFVSRIVHHERERHIVRSTIKLAHALGQTVVAEGIEDLATFDLLRKLGCDSGQGYYIGRPETLAQLRTRYAAGGGGLRGTA